MVGLAVLAFILIVLVCLPPTEDQSRRARGGRRRSSCREVGGFRVFLR